MRDERRDDPARHHRTLREAIAWSWQLLGPEEQATFASCSVFRGGFGLETAGGVLGDEGLLDRLQGLCDRSLLWVETASGGHTETRFGMYESLRTFASERVNESGRSVDVERRLARVVAGVAEQAAAGATGAQGAACRRRLSLERQNIEAVVDRAIASEDADAERLEHAVVAALALEPVADLTGAWAEWVGRVTGLEARLAAQVPERVLARARLQLARALGLVRLGRVPEASAILRALLDTAVTRDDAVLRGRTLTGPEGRARGRGRGDRARGGAGARIGSSEPARPRLDLGRPPRPRPRARRGRRPSAIGGR